MMRHNAEVFRVKNGAGQNAAIGASSAAVSNAFGTQTRIVKLDVTTGCHVNFAGAPTATTSDHHMLANTSEYFAVDPGQKVAVIQDSDAGTGTLWVSELTF